MKNFILKNLFLKTPNKKRLIQNNVDVKMLSKAESSTNETYSRAFKSFSKIQATQLTIFSKLIYNGIYFCSYMINTKRCDSCFTSSTGTYGFIEKFIQRDDKIFVIARKIVLIYNPFFSKNFPELKSKLNRCLVSNEYFVEEIQRIKKSFLIKPDDDSCFISSFTTSHLFN